MRSRTGPLMLVAAVALALASAPAASDAQLAEPPEIRAIDFVAAEYGIANVAGAACLEGRMVADTLVLEGVSQTCEHAVGLALSSCARDAEHAALQHAEFKESADLIRVVVCLQTGTVTVHSRAERHPAAITSATRAAAAARLGHRGT